MLNGKAADEIVLMLRANRPARDLLLRAHAALPTTGKSVAACSEASLKRWSQDLRAWVELALRRRPPPAHLRGLWFAVRVPHLIIQGHPQAETGEDWTLPDWWEGVVEPWTLPPLQGLRGGEVPGEANAEQEEFGVVLAAVLLRDGLRANDSRGPTLPNPLRVEVRPECAADTIEVGLLDGSGLSNTSTRQTLWGP